jgi:hypothetical protein
MTKLKMPDIFWNGGSISFVFSREPIPFFFIGCYANCSLPPQSDYSPGVYTNSLMN